MARGAVVLGPSSHHHQAAKQSTRGPPTLSMFCANAEEYKSHVTAHKTKKKRKGPAVRRGKG